MSSSAWPIEEQEHFTNHVLVESPFDDLQDRPTICSSVKMPRKRLQPFQEAARRLGWSIVAFS